MLDQQDRAPENSWIPVSLKGLFSERARELEVSVSTIQDVRAAEKKVQEILDALKNAGASDPENLRQKLVSASDAYAKAIHELK